MGCMVSLSFWGAKGKTQAAATSKELLRQLRLRWLSFDARPLQSLLLEHGRLRSGSGDRVQPPEQDLQQKRAASSHRWWYSLGWLDAAAGGLEFLSKALRFRSPGATFFCWLCNATSCAGALCYKDFSEMAGHRGTCITHADYISACVAQDVEISALFDCPGFQLLLIALDAMHLFDLGIHILPQFHTEFHAEFHVGEGV